MERILYTGEEQARIMEGKSKNKPYKEQLID